MYHLMVANPASAPAPSAPTTATELTVKGSKVKRMKCHVTWPNKELSGDTRNQKTTGQNYVEWQTLTVNRTRTMNFPKNSRHTEVVWHDRMDSVSTVIDLNWLLGLPRSGLCDAWAGIWRYRETGQPLWEIPNYYLLQTNHALYRY
jgi:hypothetical protein